MIFGHPLGAIAVLSRRPLGWRWRRRAAGFWEQEVCVCVKGEGVGGKSLPLPSRWQPGVGGRVRRAGGWPGEEGGWQALAGG